ncbi:uncharacterized protein LOC114854066 isoform X2 [Betta splendens]|nr:uncharacterized protein LOC114854066 isoform X2 [Betta splendens]
MQPQHMRNNVLIEAQSGDPPFETDYELGKEGEPIRVTLRSKDSNTFMGFMLEAREQGRADEVPPVGRFILLDPENTQLLECEGSPGSAVIQNNNHDKSEIKVNWTSQGDTRNIAFRTTFLQNFRKFWKPVDKNVMPPTTPTSEPSSTSALPTTTITASTSEPSSTSAPPTTTTTTTTSESSSTSITSEPSSTSAPPTTTTTTSTSEPSSTSITSEPSSTSAPPTTTTTASTSEPSSTSAPLTTTTIASTSEPSSTSAPPTTTTTARTSEPSSTSAPPTTTSTTTTSEPSSTSAPLTTTTIASTSEPSSTSAPLTTTTTASTSEPSSTSAPPTTTTTASASEPSSTSITSEPCNTSFTSEPSTTACTTNPSSTLSTSELGISVNNLQHSKDMIAAAMTTMTFDSLGVVLGMELCNLFSIITSLHHGLNKGIKITCTVFCGAAEISALVLCCMGDLNKAVLIPLVVATIVINFIELIIESLPLGSKQQSQADIAAKACSVIHELLTIAVMFVTVWETDHCRKNQNESWLVTVVAVYAAWMFLFVIWVFVLHQTKLWRKVNSTVNPEKQFAIKMKFCKADKAFSVILIVGTVAFNVAIIYGIFGCPKLS